MTISNNLTILRKTIPDSVCLIAVSKTKSEDAILEAYAAGQLDFAENYAQEFASKFDACAGKKIRWHFIGHLQSNKAKLVVGKAYLIHTLDRLSLAETIEKLAAAQNITQHCLIEVKLSHDENKTGCTPEDVKSFLKQLENFKHIAIDGLMTVGSLNATAEETRNEFKKLRTLRDELGLKALSMGMSHDYENAIQEGATMVRIGTKIFGDRE